MPDKKCDSSNTEAATAAAQLSCFQAASASFAARHEISDSNSQLQFCTPCLENFQVQITFRKHNTRKFHFCANTPPVHTH